MRLFAVSGCHPVPAIVVDATGDHDPLWETVYTSSVRGVSRRKIEWSFSRAYGHTQHVTQVAHVQLPHSPGAPWRAYVADDGAEDLKTGFVIIPGVNDGRPLPCPVLIVYPADKADPAADAQARTEALRHHLTGCVRNMDRRDVLVEYPEVLGVLHVCTEGAHVHAVREIPHA